VLTLGAASVAERDAWIFFLTRFIPLHIPPDADAEEAAALAAIPVGASPPLHVRKLVDTSGEKIHHGM
jgi:hypothetical protein